MVTGSRTGAQTLAPRMLQLLTATAAGRSPEVSHGHCIGPAQDLDGDNGAIPLGLVDRPEFALSDLRQARKWSGHRMNVLAGIQND